MGEAGEGKKEKEKGVVMMMTALVMMRAAEDILRWKDDGDGGG